MGGRLANFCPVSSLGELPGARGHHVGDPLYRVFAEPNKGEKDGLTKRNPHKNEKNKKTHTRGLENRFE